MEKPSDEGMNHSQEVIIFIAFADIPDPCTRMPRCLSPSPGLHENTTLGADIYVFLLQMSMTRRVLENLCAKSLF